MPILYPWSFSEKESITSTLPKKEVQLSLHLSVPSGWSSDSKGKRQMEPQEVQCRNCDSRAQTLQSESGVAHALDKLALRICHPP